MKVLSLACLILSVSEASAFFSFGNLLFAIGVCKVPTPGCKVHCKGPLAPKKFCQCDADSSDRRYLEESSECYGVEACEGFSGSNYEQCVAHANYDTDGDVEVAESSVADGGNSGNQTISTSRRMKWLPFVIAGVVLTMFFAVAVRVRRKKSNPELQAALDTEDDLHGGVAKRLERIESGRPVNPLARSGTETSFIKTASGSGASTPYSLA